MIGADRVKTWPRDGQPLDAKLGDKKPDDLIGDNIVIAWSGTTGKVTGDIYNISEPWLEFDETKNTGHFFPVKLDAKYAGREITFIGSVTVKARDLDWVVRVDDLPDKKATFMDGEDVIAKLDFTPATLAA